MLTNKPPKNFAEAGQLLGNPELPKLLEQQLIWLAFDVNATVAFRAIELLLSRPRTDEYDDLDNLSDGELLAMLRAELDGDLIDV